MFLLITRCVRELPPVAPCHDGFVSTNGFFRECFTHPDLSIHPLLGRDTSKVHHETKDKARESAIRVFSVPEAAPFTLCEGCHGHRFRSPGGGRANRNQYLLTRHRHSHYSFRPGLMILGEKKSGPLVELQRKCGQSGGRESGLPVHPEKEGDRYCRQRWFAMPGESS